jgi:predicted DNA-binding protein YlxM (UPF0122 family)
MKNLSIVEVAKLFGISEQAVFALIQRGRIKAITKTPNKPDHKYVGRVIKHRSTHSVQISELQNYASMRIKELDEEKTRLSVIIGKLNKYPLTD